MRKRVDYSRKLQELEKRAAFLIGELESIREIEGELKGALWKKLEQKSSEEYNAIDDKLFEFEKLTDREIVSLLAQRKQLVKTMALKNYVANKENFEEELSKVKGKIRELKDQHK